MFNKIIKNEDLTQKEKDYFKKLILNGETERKRKKEKVSLEEREVNKKNVSKMKEDNNYTEANKLKEGEIYKMFMPKGEIIAKLKEIKNNDYFFENISGGEKLVSSGSFLDKNIFPLPYPLLNMIKFKQMIDNDLKSVQTKTPDFGLGY